MREEEPRKEESEKETTMNKPMSNFHFKFISFGYKFRDFFFPRKNILKPNGILSFSDHHMKENEIVSKVTNRGLFRLSRKAIRRIVS